MWLWKTEIQNANITVKKFTKTEQKNKKEKKRNKRKFEKKGRWRYFQCSWRHHGIVILYCFLLNVSPVFQIVKAWPQPPEFLFTPLQKVPDLFEFKSIITSLNQFTWVGGSARFHFNRISLGAIRPVNSMALHVECLFTAVWFIIPKIAVSGFGSIWHFRAFDNVKKIFVQNNERACSHCSSEMSAKLIFPS